MLELRKLTKAYVPGKPVIVGGGNRSSKVRLDPHALERLPNARVADIANPR